MRGSNLDINIAVNSDKARADLELLKAQLRATDKEVRNLANTGAKVGDALPSAALQGATARAGTLRREINALNRSLAQTGEVAEATGKSITFSARSFRSLEAAVFNLGRQFGGIGIAAFAGVRAIGEVVRALDAQVERLVKIRDLARETAQKPAAAAAAQNIARAAGEDAEVADKILKARAEQFAKLQAERLKQGNVLPIQTDADRKLAEQRQFLMGGAQVLRGGKDPTSTTIDLANATELLTDKTKRYNDTQADALRHQNDLDKAFLQVAQSGRLGASALNELSMNLNKVSAEAVIPFLTKRVAEFDAELAKVEQPINAAEEAVKRLRIEQGLLQNKVNESTLGMTQSYVELQTAVLSTARGIVETGVTNFAQLEGEAAKTIGEAEIKTAQAVAESSRSWMDVIRNDFSSLLDGMLAAAARTADLIARAFASVRAAFGSAGAGLPTNPNVSAPMAAGGMIRGAGSGTSDSILARLSNGEFVMRAAAVDAWGPRFMAALNAMQNPFGYNAGGLVRFADGGLVAAGGGTGRAVHLHLGGHEFALSGAGNVVDALVTESHRQRMRSGGLKPSWYGGRVSG